MELATIDFFSADAEWARLCRPEVERRIHTRLGRLSTWLGEKDYLEGRFTVGDLMMAAVLRELRHTDFLAAHANLAARSEEHTSELQPLMRNSYAVFGLTTKIQQTTTIQHTQQS